MTPSSRYEQFTIRNDGELRSESHTEQKTVQQTSPVLADNEELEFSAMMVEKASLQAAALLKNISSVPPRGVRKSTGKHRYVGARVTEIMEDSFAAMPESHLRQLGFFVVREFVMPSLSPIQLDFYIAAPLRAFVEIKLRQPRAANEVTRLYAQIRAATQIFCGECVPIW